MSQRYLDLLHAMQTGIAYELEKDPSAGTPKHLRVGINSAHVSDAALVELLIRKGLFTREEYMASLEEAAETEVKSYESRLSRYGTKITLL